VPASHHNRISSLEKIPNKKLVLGAAGDFVAVAYNARVQRVARARNSDANGFQKNVARSREVVVRQGDAVFFLAKEGAQ
jgi:hypothetical protein